VVALDAELRVVKSLDLFKLGKPFIDSRQIDNVG